MFFKLLRYDLKNGLGKGYLKYLAAVLVFLAVCADFMLQQNDFFSWEPDPSVRYGTVGDFLFGTLGGMKEYVPSGIDPFQFPVAWMGIFLFLSYLLLYYPAADLETAGQNMLLRCGGRTIWWFSKCVWVAVSVLLYFCLLFVVCVTVAFCWGATPSLGLSDYIFNLFRIEPEKYCYQGDQLVLELFVGPPLAALAVNLLQTLLSLYIKPFFSFLVSALIYLSSTYYVSPFFIGNYAMASRSIRFIHNGVDPIVGICFSLGVSLAVFLAGGILFRRYDIVNRE